MRGWEDEPSIAAQKQKKMEAELIMRHHLSGINFQKIFFSFLVLWKIYQDKPAKGLKPDIFRLLVFAEKYLAKLWIDFYNNKEMLDWSDHDSRARNNE